MYCKNLNRADSNVRKEYKINVYTERRYLVLVHTLLASNCIRLHIYNSDLHYKVKHNLDMKYYSLCNISTFVHIIILQFYSYLTRLSMYTYGYYWKCQ